MNLYLILPDTTEIQIPPTMMLEHLVSESNYSLHRAPYSTVSVLAGDGLPVAQPLTIRGNTYHVNALAADTWLNNFINHVESAVALKIDSEEVPIHSADLIALPVGLPRVLSVTIRLFPETAV